MQEDKTEFKVPIYQRRDNEDFYQWVLRLRADLNKKELLQVITEQHAGPKMNQKALAVIIPSLGDNPLREVQQ